MPADTRQNLDAFIAALRDGELTGRAGPSFALLRPGDWPGLQRWAESFGFTFTLPELLTRCRDNPNILGPLSRSPHLSGWNLESLRQVAAS